MKHCMQQQLTSLCVLHSTALQRRPEDIDRKAAHMYSFAMMLWEIASGKVPFGGISPMRAGIMVSILLPVLFLYVSCICMCTYDQVLVCVCTLTTFITNSYGWYKMCLLSHQYSLMQVTLAGRPLESLDFNVGRGGKYQFHIVHTSTCVCSCNLLFILFFTTRSLGNMHDRQFQSTSTVMCRGSLISAGMPTPQKDQNSRGQSQFSIN